MNTNPSFDYQVAEDARLLALYPGGVVPKWNSALCKEMISESYGPECPGYRARIGDVTISADGLSWFAYGDYQGGAYKLYGSCPDYVL